EEYMTTAPKQTPREKKDCVTAAYHTDGSRIFSQVGSKRNIIPSTAPSNVTALIKRVIMLTYGNIARKYAALPLLFTPLLSTTKTNAQLTNRARTNCHDGSPKPSSSPISLRTTLLDKRKYRVNF
ncbi:hypothetical protein WN51_00180, partial [Melipona quadrifasciata]